MKTKSHSQETKLANKNSKLLLSNSSPDISKEQEFSNKKLADLWYNNCVKLNSISEDEFKVLIANSTTAYQQGRKDYEIDLMIKGKFHTSMNRKVCYDTGYKQGRKDKETEMIKEKKDKCCWSDCKRKSKYSITYISGIGNLKMCELCYNNYLNHLNIREDNFKIDGRKDAIEEELKFLTNETSNKMQIDINDIDTKLYPIFYEIVKKINIQNARFKERIDKIKKELQC